MKAFASDFDGTIYFVKNDQKMKTEDVEAIRAFQNKGNLFGVCTGRSLHGIVKAKGLEADFDFFILANGARILDKNLNEIHRKTIERDVLIKTYETMTDFGVGDIVIHANETVYTFGKGLPLQIHIESFDEIEGDNIFGISTFAGYDKAHELAEKINRDFEGKLIAYVNKSIVDVVSYGSSKGNAVKFIKDYLNIDEIAGIGDSFNDVPMFDAADVSFTFESSHEDVKEKADYIVETAADAIRIFEEK